MLVGVVSEKIRHIGNPNLVRWRDEPKATFSSTPGLDKSCPRHQLKYFGGLRGRKVGRGRDLVSLKRSVGIRQAAKGL